MAKVTVKYADNSRTVLHMTTADARAYTENVISVFRSAAPSKVIAYIWVDVAVNVKAETGDGTWIHRSTQWTPKNLWVIKADKNCNDSDHNHEADLVPVAAALLDLGPELTLVD